MSATLSDRHRLPRWTSGWDGAEDSRLWVRLVAAVALVVLAMAVELPQGVQLGYIVAAVLAPLWVRSIGAHRFGWWIVGGGLLAALAGLVLQRFSVGDHTLDTNVATSSTVVLIGSMLSFGLILWARTVMPPWRVAFWFGFGLLLTVSSSSTLFTANPWKFGFYVPVAVLALALAQGARRWWIELVVLLALTGISAVSDARSAFGLLVLAAVLIVAQLPFFRAGHRGSAVLVLIGVIVVSVVVGYIGQWLILDGALGEATQARSQAQIQLTGSIILGGRPEIAATLALMAHHFAGFGAGIGPTANEVVVAKTGMSSIGYQPDNNYVNSYMFGGHVELHSAAADLWAQAGVIGLAFAAVILIALVWSISRRIADGEASGLMLFLFGDSVFNLLFSPLLLTLPVLILALGLLVAPTSVQKAANDVTTMTGREARALRRMPSRLRAPERSRQLDRV